MNIKVGVSARHVHLNKEDASILFGENYILTKKNDLSQKGQFACCETVTLKGIKGEIENVRVLGPCREKTQVEISKTDSYKLGINPPVRNSGDLKDASLIEIIGPNGSINRNSAIIASRHIHVTKNDIKTLGLEGIEKVSIRIKGDKSGILNDVYVRENDDFSLEIHLDTDDANAFLIKNNDEVELLLK